MCGITGIIAFTDNGKKKLASASDATYAMYQRGPDAEGLFFHNNVALGHRRLSIIDTSNNAAQPMTDSSGRYTIAFNGEIFNFKELKKLLPSNTHFKSESDTEVLLNLYIQEKEKCLEKLNGFFALAIYDKEEESLFIARDRYGVKPMHYAADENTFAFASEIKSLLKYGISKEIDEASLLNYLHLNYIPSPDSIFKHIKKLEAGHFIKIHPDSYRDKNIEVKKYYEIPFSENVTTPLTHHQAEEKLKTLLHESVERRMISDVPLGCFLSGGIDSSVIAAIASQKTKHLNTFSIGFKDEPYFDETHYAELVAKKWKTNHTKFSLTTNDLYENLHNALYYMDEPFADSSALAVNILSKYTRKHVTVALSGDGADELMGGYNKHSAELKARNNSFANSVIKNGKTLFNILPKSRNSKIGNKSRQLQKFSEGLNLSMQERYWQWAGFTKEIDALKLINQKENSILAERKHSILKNLNDDFNSYLLTDMKLVLEGDMLVKVDRMSMANSLEVRTPFLDYKVVDFLFSLPSNYKIDAHSRKKILKDAFRKDLPEELYHRKKQGFEVPLLKWFRTELKQEIENLLSKKLIEEQGIFNYLEVEKLKKQLYSSSPNDSVARIWALVVFQNWWKNYINE